MENDLKQYLEAMESRINAHVDVRVDSMEQRIYAHVDARFGVVETNAESMETRINGRIEKTETNLLTAFHGWSRSMEIRVRSVSGMVTGFDERLAHVEERVSELERRRAS
jgi:hypothetical protein